MIVSDHTVVAVDMAVPIYDLNRSLTVRVVYYQRFDPFTVSRITKYYCDHAIVTVLEVRAFRDNFDFHE